MTFEELLKRDGKFVYKGKGVSMRPMLKRADDLAIIEVPEKKPGPMDVVLYRRGDKYVLHRVIKVRGDKYLIRGDNTFSLEPVRESDIIGVLTGFTHNGKRYSVEDRTYRFYSRVWNAAYPVRHGVFGLKRLGRKLSGKQVSSGSAAVPQDVPDVKAGIDVVNLVRCALCSETPDMTKFSDIDTLYRIASKHLITAAAAPALAKAGVRDERFSMAAAAAMRKTAMFEHAWKEIAGRFESEGIRYMPLKGAILKDLYPRYGMREFADHDILFDPDRAKDVRTIMTELGYSTERFGSSHHDCYYKEPVLNFEMHRTLFDVGTEQRIRDYYKNVWERLVPEEGREYGYHFTPEDFYIYMIAHEYNHYSKGGTGLRSLLDTYIYLGKMDLDMGYVAAETEKLGISGFEKKNRGLAFRLFGGEELTETDMEMLRYMFTSGVYGKTENKVGNRVKMFGGGTRGKIKYLADRIMPPMSTIESAYPFFSEHKIFLPALPFVRLGKALTVRRKSVISELKALTKNDTGRPDKSE